MKNHRKAIILWFRHLVLRALGVAFLLTAPGAQGSESQALALEASNPKLQRAFEWASAKALSYVQTGKTGVLDGHEGHRQGAGSVKYIPSYWAGYTWRTAF